MYNIPESYLLTGREIHNDEIACYYYDIIKRMYNNNQLSVLGQYVVDFADLIDIEVARKIYQLMMNEEDIDIIKMAFLICFQSMQTLRNAINEFTNAVQINMSKDDLHQLVILRDNQSKMREFIVLKNKNIPVEKIDVILNMNGNDDIEGNYKITLCGSAAESGMDLENLKQLSTLKSSKEIKLYIRAYKKGFDQEVLNELHVANDFEEMRKIIKNHISQLNDEFDDMFSE